SLKKTKLTKSVKAWSFAWLMTKRGNDVAVGLVTD
ncbi:hypothetical protein AAULR_03474, partial [Lacticaseibacillus rhamnosus MTCC 5462]